MAKRRGRLLKLTALGAGGVGAALGFRAIKRRGGLRNILGLGGPTRAKRFARGGNLGKAIPKNLNVFQLRRRQQKEARRLRLFRKRGVSFRDVLKNVGLPSFGF